MTLVASETAGLRPVGFYYLRHGETDWNRHRIVQGVTDIALNATGREQALAAERRLAAREIGTICVSPLARARETAAIVNARLCRPIVVIEALRECGFGCQEGQLVGDWWQDWRSGLMTPAGAEAYGAFLDRALVAVNEALAHPGPVLIVGHGGVYWAVQRHGGLDMSATLANATPVWHRPPLSPARDWQAEQL